MNDTAVLDPVLVRLKSELTELYGPRLKQILLYGSRARGDDREDSDYDVLVVLTPPVRLVGGDQADGTCVIDTDDGHRRSAFPTTGYGRTNPRSERLHA
jgi:predicted nucleotidyltransferase